MTTDDRDVANAQVAEAFKALGIIDPKIASSNFWPGGPSPASSFTASSSLNLILI